MHRSGGSFVSERLPGSPLPLKRMLEIERQLLLRSVEESVLRSATRVRRIRQGYLTKVGPAIRVRELPDRSVMTVKSGGGLVRREVEFEISTDVAAGLFEIAGDSTIEKTRYDVGRWEIDVFHERHEGLLIAEVELEAVDEPVPPLPAGIDVLEDVTEHSGFNNQFLAFLDDAAAPSLIAALLADPTGTLAAVRAVVDEEDHHARRVAPSWDAPSEA